MKRSVFICSIVLFVSIICSCDFGNGNKPEDKPGKKPNNNSDTNQLLTFNVKNAKAVGKLESQSKRAIAREGEIETEEEETVYYPGDVVILLEDGKVGAFIEDVKLDFLPSVSTVFPNPVDSIDDIYVLFERSTHTYYDSKGNPVPFELGQLLRVKSDGSYDDIFALIGEPETNKYIGEYYSKDSASLVGDRIRFDINGNLYFVANEEVNSISTNKIYKYDPINNTVTSMSVSAPNMRYERFQITGDGSFMFVSGYSGNNSAFLRAIDISNSDLYENLTYNGIPYYYYDDETEYLYMNGYNGGFARLKKSSDSKYLEKNIERLTTDILFPSISPNDIMVSYPVTFHAGAVTTEQILKSICERMYGSNYSEVDLRFDALAEFKGYKILAKATAGKKNEEAIDIVMEDELLRGLFYNIITSYTIAGDSYHPETLIEPKNYLFYAKGTDNLLKGKQDYIGSGNLDFLGVVTTLNSYGMAIPKYKYELLDEYKENPKALLDLIFSYCQTSKEKYFTLKNLSKYDEFKDAPSTLINEDAIAWLFENEDRKAAVYQFLYHNETYDPLTQNKSFGSTFLHETCLCVANDKPAYALRKTDSKSISYSFNNMFRNKKGLYGLDGGYVNQTVVQIINEEGYFTFETPSSLTGHKPKTLTKCNNGFVFDEDANLGFHSLFYLNLDEDTVTNILTNLPNNDHFELFTYTSAGDEVYYSGVIGSKYITCIANVNTLENKVQNVALKLSDIIALK